METSRVLGVEGGGTKTSWALANVSGGASTLVEQGQLPAANFRLRAEDELLAMLGTLPRGTDRVGIFLAGCATAEDRTRLLNLCARLWPNIPVVAGSDRDSGFAAAFGASDGIAVNAGTGSSVTGRRGELADNAGGWGHILGDLGGGYNISRETLRVILRDFDLNRRTSRLTASILRSLCLNTLDELVRWAQTADKMDLATLTPTVFVAAEEGDSNVLEVLRNGSRVLAQYTAAVAGRLQWPDPDVRLLGGLFRGGSDVYVNVFRDQLALLLPRARVAIADQAPELGAVWLAARAPGGPSSSIEQPTEERSGEIIAKAITEQRNERSRGLERMTTDELVRLFVSEETVVQDALKARGPELAAAVEMVYHALGNGGRLFYVGAGTSGRLGVLDASEIPPTFGASPELVQGIIAGGVTALHRSVEGAEDEAGAGAMAVDQRAVAKVDIVCGISASGRTPFVLGALQRATESGARTILLSCNPARHASWPGADLNIDLPTGPELLTGSTRLKAGTATKIALNILTTVTMIRLGKVRDNLMIDVSVSNTKLRDRAARVVSELATCSYADAVARLQRNGWNVRAAIGEPQV